MGEALTGGKIVNSNRYTFQGVLQNTGCVTEFFGCPGDTVEEIAAAFSQAAEACDVMITTGGVSVGDYDLVPRCPSGGWRHSAHAEYAAEARRKVLFWHHWKDAGVLLVRQSRLQYDGILCGGAACHSEALRQKELGAGADSRDAFGGLPEKEPQAPASGRGNTGSRAAA